MSGHSSQHNSSDNMVSSSSYSNNQQILNAISCANSQTNNSFMPSVSHSNASITMSSDPSTNSNSLDVYNTSPFSPDDSSYSENSDYTSDEYDSDGNNYNNKYTVQTLAPMESTSSSIPSSNAISSSTSSLPPFPTISANSVANSVNAVNGPSDSFLAFTQSNQFAGNHLSGHTLNAQPFSPQYVIHQQLYNYSELYQRHYLLSNGSTSSNHQNCSPNSSSHTLIANTNISQTNSNICEVVSLNNTVEDVHQYTDLSLSIASSSAAESLNGLLSAATASNSKDNRLTPVPFNGVSLQDNSENDLLALVKENGESQESSSFVSSDSSEADNHLNDSTVRMMKGNEGVAENCDNFGEIIKKTIVETVSA